MRRLSNKAAFIIEKFDRDTIKDKAKFGLSLEIVTIVHRIQGLVERVLDPEITIPGGILLWVRKSYLKGFFNQWCQEAGVAIATKMYVSNELLLNLPSTYL